ncbi:hypothetical protein H5410_007784 [Solanum commersonii]|uniref:Uncharacterized protein n=1 Tax=Solanum commersonii TaxID=4109 RepID=A0A9J6AD11_SOLCO|nr:hypothetical protein H5410_007784 [Solanum commersonii]
MGITCWLMQWTLCIVGRSCSLFCYLWPCGKSVVVVANCMRFSGCRGIKWYCLNLL